MTVTEKAAHLRGYVEGIELDESKPEAKIIDKLLDVIDDLAFSVADLEDELALVTEQLDAVDEDLDALEDFVYEGECCEDCGCEHDGDYYGELYEVECPSCHELVEFDEESILDGSAECPNCGEMLEFDFECDCDDCAEEDE